MFQRTHQVFRRLSDVLGMCYIKLRQQDPDKRHRLTPVRNQFTICVCKIDAGISQLSSCRVPLLGTTEQKLVTDRPSEVKVALANNLSPIFPAGRIKDVEMSVDRPVMKCPLDATAREPSVSVSDNKSPPCTVCMTLSVAIKVNR